VPKKQHLHLHVWNSQQWPNISPQRPPICLGGALGGCVMCSDMRLPWIRFLLVASIKS
jgi:hypothetical protein